MSSLNKVHLIGRLGRDPEVKYLASGDAVCNFSMATSESWKDKKTGEKKEATEWHNISMYGRLAEIAGEYLQKGSLIYVEGKLKTRKWQDRDGNDRYTTEVNCNEMRMLGSKSDTGGGRDSDNGGEQRRKATQQKKQSDFDDDDSDIPF